MSWSEFVQSALQSPWVLITANLASIASLGITALVWWNVREISRSFLFRARLPQHVRALRTQMKKLGELLRDFEGRPGEIRSLLAECEARVASVATKLPASHRAGAKRLSRQLARARATMDKESVWAVHGDVHLFVTRVAEFRKDIDWS